MEKIDVKDLMDERYKYWTNKKTLGLEKALDFYCVYRYLNKRDDISSEFADDVFDWAHSDYNVNKFLGTLDIDHNINSKPAIQMTPTNVYDFLDAIETKYPKHVKKRAMESRAKSLKKSYDAWIDEHSPQMKMSLSAVASILAQSGIAFKFVKAKVSTNVKLSNLEGALKSLKIVASNLSKANEEKAGKLRDSLSDYADKVKAICEDLTSMRNEITPADLNALKSLYKYVLAVGNLLFPRPDLRQLSDHKLGRYYTKLSAFRALSSKDAKMIEESNDAEDALFFISNAVMGLQSRDTELLNLKTTLE